MSKKLKRFLDLWPQKENESPFEYTTGEDSDPEFPVSQAGQALIEGRNVPVLQSEVETPRTGEIQDEFLNNSMANNNTVSSINSSITSVTKKPRRTIADALKELEDNEREQEDISSDPDSDGDQAWKNYLQRMPEANKIDAAAKAKEILDKTEKDRKLKVQRRGAQKMKCILEQKLPNLGSETTNESVKPKNTAEPGSFTVKGKRITQYKKGDKENQKQRTTKEKKSKARAKRAMERSSSSDFVTSDSEEMRTPPMRKKKRTKKAQVTLLKVFIYFIL